MNCKEFKQSIDALIAVTKFLVSLNKKRFSPFYRRALEARFSQ